MLMVVNAAGMQHADANDDSKQDSSGTSGAEVSISSSAAALGEGAKSLPSFCRLVNRHVGKPLGQLRFMLESGYPKLDVSYFNAASPGGQTNFLTSSGDGEGGASGMNKSKSKGKGRRSSRQQGASSSSIRSEYRFVYFNGG